MGAAAVRFSYIPLSKSMAFLILPFALATAVTGDNDPGYVAALIKAGLIG